MIQALIVVDGNYYCGENTDETIRAQPGWSQNSWHGAGVDKIHALKFSSSPDDAKIVRGKRMLKSEMDRIIGSIMDGRLTCKRIEVVIDEGV